MVEVNGFSRGHPIYFDEATWCWRYTDGAPLPGEGELDRPCLHCGAVFAAGEPDPCLGWLPGVVSACCGHGVPSQAVIVFANGMAVRGFEVDRMLYDGWNACASVGNDVPAEGGSEPCA